MIHISKRERRIGVERLIRKIGGQIFTLENELQAIPRHRPARQQERRLLQQELNEKNYAKRMLLHELSTLQ